MQRLKAETWFHTHSTVRVAWLVRLCNSNEGGQVFTKDKMGWFCYTDLAILKDSSHI